MTKNITYNNLINKFQELSERHPQLNYFGSGDLTKIQTEKKGFPYMWVSPTDGSGLVINNKRGLMTNLNFNILVLDRLNFTNGISNEQDVLSDTLQIIQDVIHNFIKETSVQMTFNINSDIGLSPVFEGDEDTKNRELGWFIEITLGLPYISCSTPLK